MTAIPASRVAPFLGSQSPGQHDTARVESMIEACFRSDDYREGQRAFAEKRPPAFTGR